MIPLKRNTKAWVLFSVDQANYGGRDTGTGFEFTIQPLLLPLILPIVTIPPLVLQLPFSAFLFIPWVKASIAISCVRCPRPGARQSTSNLVII